MPQETLKCEHACRSSCAMLTSILREETELIKSYEFILKECDYPDVSSFVRDLVESKSGSILKILQKLNELRARSEIGDGVMSSYDQP